MASQTRRRIYGRIFSIELRTLSLTRVAGPYRQTREAPFLAIKGHDFFFCTAAALKSQETICWNHAFNERFEFIYDILWEITVFCLMRLKEAVQVLVYDFEAWRELGATPLVSRGFVCLLCHPRNKALQKAK